MAILGDNLGSHGIGGFTENFSRTKYICRYCLITRAEFEENPSLLGVRLENYRISIDGMIDDDLEGNHGIKFDSPFNKLGHYHVYGPGLPPCLAHDIFEGVLAHDSP
jgi:hypothetical protein